MALLSLHALYKVCMCLVNLARFLLSLHAISYICMFSVSLQAIY